MTRAMWEAFSERRSGPPPPVFLRVLCALRGETLESSEQKAAKEAKGERAGFLLAFLPVLLQTEPSPVPLRRPYPRPSGRLSQSRREGLATEGTEDTRRRLLSRRRRGRRSPMWEAFSERRSGLPRPVFLRVLRALRGETLLCSAPHSSAVGDRLPHCLPDTLIGGRDREQRVCTNKRSTSSTGQVHSTVNATVCYHMLARR